MTTLYSRLKVSLPVDLGDDPVLNYTAIQYVSAVLAQLSPDLLGRHDGQYISCYGHGGFTKVTQWR